MTAASPSTVIYGRSEDALISNETNVCESLTCRWRVGDPLFLTALWSCGMWEEVWCWADARCEFWPWYTHQHTHSTDEYFFIETSWAMMQRLHWWSCAACLDVTHDLDMTGIMRFSFIACFIDNSVCVIPLRCGLIVRYLKSTWSTGLVLYWILWVINGLLFEWHKRDYFWFQENVSIDILCIFEVKQAVKYMGYLPRLFMRQTFSMVYGSIK